MNRRVCTSRLSPTYVLWPNLDPVLKEGERELYRFWTIEPAINQEGEMAFGVTDLYPGTIGY
jgi:hypothetical protein